MRSKDQKYKTPRPDLYFKVVKGTQNKINFYSYAVRIILLYVKVRVL